jgi:restriction endonuclease S subunit
VRLDKAKVYPLFYYYFFASPPGRRLVSTIVAGTNVKGIRSTELRELRIPIPTKTEQETIADALSDADALIASVQQLLTKKRNLKQGAMHELLTGKRRLPGFATSKGCAKTEVGMLPEDWEVTTVREVAATVRNAIVGGPFGSDLVSNDYVEEGVPVIRGQNLGFRFVTGSFVFVTPAKAHSLESNLARPSDLVFTQRGTLGQISLVPDEPFDRYLVSQSQMKLTLDRRSADPGFFYYLFSSSKQQEFIRQNTIQTGVPHINLGILRAIPVQRPSLVEQKAIAAILSEMDAEIAALEAKLTKSRQIKQGMMQELLTGRIRLV